MRAGLLRDQVVLQHNNGTRDAEGGVSTSWATLDTVWASIEERGGTEQSTDGTPVAGGMAIITIRQNPLIDAAGKGSAVRVQFDPGNSEKVRVYDVIGVQRDDKRRMHVLTARELY